MPTAQHQLERLLSLCEQDLASGAVGQDLIDDELRATGVLGFLHG